MQVNNSGNIENFYNIKNQEDNENKESSIKKDSGIKQNQFDGRNSVKSGENKLNQLRAQKQDKPSPQSNNGQLQRGVASGAGFVNNAAALILSSANQRQTGKTANSKIGEEAGEGKEVDRGQSLSVPHQRVKRSENPEESEGNRQALPLRDESETPAISLITMDPDLITPMVQNQFWNFAGLVKKTKETMPPDVMRQVSNFIRDKIKESTNIDVDPDKTYINTFSGAEALQDGSDGVTGWQHNQKDLTESKTLTERILEGFGSTWRSGTTDQLNQSFGIYKAGSGAGTFGAHNEVKILPSDLRKIFNDGDLEKYLTDRQDSFWSNNKSLWRALAKTEFSGLARKAGLDGQLTQQGYQLAMLGAASDVPRDKPAKLSQMRSEASSDPSVHVLRLDINGYSATDILRFSGQDGREVLYIPGEKQSFYEFDNEDKLKEWVAKQAGDPDARRELESHFSIYDRSQGHWGIFSHTGVDEGLSKLASNEWGANSIDMQAVPIHGDIFTDMAERHKERNEDDLRQISSDSDRRTKWLDDLKKSDSASFTKPVSRALAAGGFAADVGAQGGQAFVAASPNGRHDVKQAAGMNVALTLLLAPSAQSSSRRPVSSQPSDAPASDRNMNFNKRTEFEPVEFPPRDEVGAINEINGTMKGITGEDNFKQYHSLNELEKSASNRDDTMLFTRIKNSFEEVHNRLNSASDRLHDPREKDNILKTLGNSLNTTDGKVLGQAYDRLKSLSLEALDRFDSFRDFDYKKVTFFQRRDGSKQFSEDEQNTSTSAFVNTKDRSRLMINVDGPDEGIHRLSDTEAAQGYNVELVDSIMNQMTRLANNTHDYLNVKKEETDDGFSLGTAETALSQFKYSTPNNDVCRNVLGKDPNYPDDSATRDILGINGKRAVTDDMRMKAATELNNPDSEYYHRKAGISGGNPVTESDREKVRNTINYVYTNQERQAVSERIKQDDMLRSDLLTSNADTAALYLRDIAGKRAYDTPVHRGVKPDVNTRELSLDDPANRRDFDLLLSSIKKSSPVNTDEKSMRELAMKLLSLKAAHTPNEFNYYNNGKKTSGYAVEDPYGTLHVFHTEEEALNFRDRDVFWKEVGERLKNPVGSFLYLVGDILGTSTDTKDYLYELGRNPLGKSWALVAKAEGASKEVQDRFEKGGEYVERSIPVWGQARMYADVGGKALTGENPSDDIQDIGDAVKDIASSVSGKQVRLKPAPGSENTASSPSRNFNDQDAGKNKPAGKKDTLGERLKRIQDQGLGGKGGPKAAQKWAQEDGRTGLPGDGADPSKPGSSHPATEASQSSIASGDGTQPAGRGSAGQTPSGRKLSGLGQKRFKANRGGNALESTALSYAKFKQPDLFRKRNPTGVCQGLSFEVLQRLDRSDGTKANLSSAVESIKKGLKKSSPGQKDLVSSIESKQRNPNLAGFKNYAREYSQRYRLDRQMSINALENDIRKLAPGDAALVRMKIQGKHGTPLDEGHMLVIQRLDHQGYQLFDANNGVFSYKTQDSLTRALEPYMDSAYADQGVMAPDSFTRYKYQPASGEGAGAAPRATTQAGPSDVAGNKPGSPDTPDARPFGQDHDFPYIDAETVPNPEAHTPSAASLLERDLQIEKEKKLQNIADPRSADYPAHVDRLIAKVRDETGVIGGDLAGLQKVAYQYNTIIGIRPVDRFATGLIGSGYETKGFHIKGKSASWGPQAGLICADQRFSKLENADPARIRKFDAEIAKSIQDKDAVLVPLKLEQDRLDTLVKMGVISEMSTPDSNGVSTFTATAPSGTQYRFEATPTTNAGQKLFAITTGRKPIEVLAPAVPGSNKPFTADYDLLLVGPSISDLGPQDNLPSPGVSQTAYKERIDRYKNLGGINPNLKDAYEDPKKFYAKNDPDMGNVTERVRTLIPVLNNEVMMNAAVRREKVFHHGDDTSNPVTEPSANYPGTFVLPFKMGRFDEVTIVHNQDEFKELVQVAKDHGYHVPLNPLWDPDLTNVRRTAFTDARNQYTGADGARGVTLTTGNAQAGLPGLMAAGRDAAARFFRDGRQNELPPVQGNPDIDNAARFFNSGAKPGLKSGGADNGGSPPVQRIRTDASATGQLPRPGTSQGSTTAPGLAANPFTHPKA